MRVASRRCAYCNLTRPLDAFTLVWSTDEKRMVPAPFDKQCETMIWPALVSEYPELRGLRDVLYELSLRAEPAAPSKGWDEQRIRTPLREGQKPDGITDDGGTFKTAAGSREDRFSVGWANREIRDLWKKVYDRVYPDPSERKIRVNAPRCQKGSCNHRGKVGDTFCGKCGSEFSVRTKEAVNG